MDEDERQRKLEAGRAKKPSAMPRSQPLASFREKRAKGDGEGAQKKTAKRKGQNVPKTDRPAQERPLEPAPAPASGAKEKCKINHEVPQKPKTFTVHQIHGQKIPSQHPSQGPIPSPVEEMEDELIALTGKEQLKQLQQAVEKRNEIIAKLSSNLQEAQASRDQVQLEAQSLAGQIQALQKQLQQTSVEFLRIKCQTGVSEPPHSQQRHGSKDSVPSCVELPLGELKESLNTNSKANGDTETDALLLRLSAELEEERSNSRRICEELIKEKENCQNMLSLLEEEKREMKKEMKQREAQSELQLRDLQEQISQAQSQSFEIQRYKEEKELLNTELQETTRMLVREQENAERLKEEVASSALRLCNLEEERERREEETRRLEEEHREELDRIRQLLEEGEKEIDKLEKEDSGIKASKNRQNQERVSFGQDEDEEGGPDQEELSEDGLARSVCTDILMERYLSTAKSNSCQANQSFEEHILEENSGNYSFELNSEILGDSSHLFSISNPLRENYDNLLNFSDAQCSAASDLVLDCYPRGVSPGWPINSPCSGDAEFGEASRQLAEEPADLAKELLGQQCEELREELDLKERELDILREEVSKSAEELEEARSRWAQVTEELKEALWELEEEKEKKRSQEQELEEANLNTSKQDVFENKDSPLLEEKEDGSSLLFITTPLSALLADKLPGNLTEAKDQVVSELVDTKARHETTAALLVQKTLELDSALKDLNATRLQVEAAKEELEKMEAELEESRRTLGSTEEQRSRLEDELVSLKHTLVPLEEAQVQAGEAHRLKEEEMDRQLRKMEQILEEELEQFETLIQAKEDELAEVREKWEDEQQEKEEELRGARRLLEEQRGQQESEVKTLMEKQAVALEETTKRLRQSHHEEVEELSKKHQAEVSELNCRLERELSAQKAALGEEHRKQISLIKQVTEREHHRMLSELSAEHGEEMSQLKLELTSRLTESMETAHHAATQQAQTKQSVDMEALRLSLADLHTSRLELSQANLQREREAALSQVQAELRDKWTGENAMLQAKQQFELERLRQQNQQDLDELRQQYESRLLEEKSSTEMNRANEIQVMKSQWEDETEKSMADLRTVLSETQKSLDDTLAELSVTRTSLDELRASSVADIQRLEEELNLAWADRDAAASALEELVSSKQTLLKEKELQSCHLEEKERQLQQEVCHLQEELTTLKKTSEQEAGHLWAQLDSMRTSRQELGELREQLLARSSRVDDLERLKADFNDQRREIKQHNEAELEGLRRYFEQRLRTTEESYREEIALLQLRLVESALEESLLKTGDASFTTEGDAAEERNDLLAEFTLKLEKHKEDLDSLRLQLEEKHEVELSNLRCSLSLSYKEELLQVRSDLTERYYEDLETMKTRHALDLEQLRARLSEKYVQELTKLRFEAARQVEAEVEQRTWCHSEELRSRMTIIHTLEGSLSALGTQHATELQRNTQQLKKDFANDLLRHLEEARQLEKQRVMEELSSGNQEEVQRLRAELQKEHQARISSQEEQRTRLEEELEKSRAMVASLESDQSQHDGEMQKAKSSMSAEVKELAALLQKQGEERLQQADLRFQEEKGQLEQCLAHKESVSLGEWNDKHQAALEQQRTALLNKHAQELHGVTTGHKEQLDALSARHRDQLAAMATELDTKHTAVLVAMEASLDSKWKAELEHLAAVFQETNQAQLEALESELAVGHKNERDELERRMLSNMDTLEATYLKEVQALRDDMEHQEESHTQDVERLKTAHVQELERLQTELVSGREGLRMELAQMHMGKFSAMATELSNAHKVDLSAQKEALDAEHCKALETLKMQVLELEEQHGNALQELSHSYNTEKQQLCDQHQVQLQELRQVSAQELEVCRRELKEESSRQHVQFKEEMQLFKVQSEERLQDRLGKLKAELEQCKEAELEEQRRSFSTEHEQKEQGYTEKMSQLTAQLQQLDDVVAQLRAEVDGLQGELEGKRAEMETLDTLLQRRDREGQEGGNLLNMLGQDLQTAKEDRLKMHQANEKLRKVLLDVIRSTVATEEMIGQKITVGPRRSQQPANHRSSTGNSEAQESGVSLGEDSELTQLLCESLLVSETQLHPAGEEAALGACGRLRLAVDTLLELLNQANAQLEQAHSLHLSLEQRCSKGREDSGHILKQHTVLLEQLNQEAGLKSHLHLELHKAEGLLDGYVSEKVLLEEALQQKESREERLAEELEGLRVQLHQTESLSAELEGLRVQLRQMEGLTAELNNLRAQHQDLSEEHAVLLRQREHLSAGLGEREKALLAEAECLARERLDLQRQAEKDRNTLSLRLRTLETELEERETKGLETELHHKAHSEDLNMHVQALEKQIKHNRQFIDEQAVEREHERDEFQQEINRLEDQLRQTSRGQAGGESRGQRIEDLVQQVENLQALIKDKTEDYDSLIAANQQAQNDLIERNDEIDKLAGRIRELEQALLSSADSNRAVSQLEQEVQRTKLRERELLQDKQGLEQQQLANKLQIAALQSKLDERRHYHEDAPDPTQPLRDALDTAQLSLQSREQEVELLMSQLEQVQANFSIKEVELKHLALQLELMTNQNEAHVQQLQDKIVTLEENVSALTIQQEEREELREEEEEESLPSALLQEKNLEIDQLNQEIQRLEVELEGSERDVALGAELEELRSRVEHLGSDISRLRQDKQDEEERLHEVISTLQAELATLGPALHEVSDSQDGDSVNPSPSPSPELRNYPLPGGAGRKGAPGSLRQELRLTRSSPSVSSSSKSLRARLDVLQTQLETAAAEKESLQRLLLTQEEEYRGHGEELGRRLAEGRERAEELRELLAQKEAQLEEADARIARRPEGEYGEKETEEEEEERWRAQATEINALRGERDQLSSAVVELRQSEEKRLETQKKKEKELADRVESLREANVALQRQIQHTSARVEAMEQLVAEGKAQVLTLEMVKAELFAEREALRRREGRLQEEIECLRQEVVAQRAVIKQLQLRDKEEVPERDQKEVLTHAELTLAKADLALREKEAELASLSAEQQALRAELAAVKEGLCSSTERAEKLQEEGQTKDRALADLETYNHCLKAELRGLQEDLAVQEEELAFQQRELHHLRQRCDQQEDHTQGSPQKALSHGGFEDHLGGSRDEASLSSPEVLRRLECSEDRTRDPFHASVLRGSRLSLNSTTGLDLPQGKASTKARMMEQPRSRTITPESVSRSTRSPGSTTASDNFSMACSLDVDKMDTLDLTAPPSPVGSISSLSAPEWASDGYGSNVSSELGVRLRTELEHTERLDAQFVEYLRCRGMNPAANTDSAAGSWSFSDELLSPELQEILKRVHQESCRILTLSQRRATTSSEHQGPVSTVLSLDQTPGQSHDQASPLDRPDGFPSAPPMGWQQEKRALQETVVALRELLCRMAQRDTQGAPGGDGNRQQTATAGSDGRVEVQLRAELQETQKRLREELEETRKQLRVELGETQSQLSASQITQQEHRNAVQSLRLALQVGEEGLQEEQSHVEELQALLEQERALTLRREREEKERREVMQGSLEQKESEVVALSGQLEQETVACSNLRRELQIEQSRSGLLKKRLGDAHSDHQGECKRSAQQRDLHLQERSRLERLLQEAEERLDAAHGTLEEEKERCASTLDGFGRRQEANEARDGKLITDMQAQLEQERRQGEELAAVTDRLRAELLQVKRRGEEEEEQRRRDEARREKEAAARLRHALESLKEQKRAAGCALAAERERGVRQGVELAELKERLQAATDEEREREKQRERERRKDSQKQMERERRQERTNNKLCELELLREQDQQRVQELQQTLSELEREGREMAAQRLSGSAHHTRTGPTANRSAQTDDTVPRDQAGSSTELVQRLLGENSELTERVAFLSQERVALKHMLAGLERQRRRAENDLAKVAMETENRPIIGDAVGNGKVQRLYERYLRAESFRKSLVYQKRYLVLLLGGFQECEQATLCLIASMGARPSSTVQSKRRPLRRFRAAVCAVIAVSRMKFLTKKWHRAIRRMSISGGVNGHSSGCRPEVLKLQQRSNSEASPPTRDGNLLHRASASTLVPPVKSPFRLHNRAHSGSTATSVHAGTSQDPERSLTEYIHHLEKVQRRLVGSKPVNKAHLAPPSTETIRKQAACSRDMIGYRQRWLKENRTWLYLSCLSPLYLNGPGSSAFHLQTNKSEH